MLAIVLAGPAIAAPARTGEQRQALNDLAYVLGQSHALHRVCAGQADNTWRGRMERLIEVEAPNAVLKAQLTERFNAGFASQAGVTDCPAASAAEADIARRGGALSRKLALAAP